jgi:hypothetical protein
MIQQNESHIERFLPRFEQFVAELQRRGETLNLEPGTAERFVQMEERLAACVAAFLIATGPRGAGKRLVLPVADEATAAAYREAVLNAHVLLAALEQSPGTPSEEIEALKEILGRAPALPSAPTNLAVQRHDSGVIVIGWQHEPAEKERQFEVAIATGPGGRGKPRDPQVPLYDPFNWHERWRTPNAFFLHEPTARGGGPIQSATVIWYAVRAVYPPDIPSAWSRRLDVICRPPQYAARMR